MDNAVLITPERLKKDVEHLKEWMSKEAHLPKIDDDEWFITFLHHNKYSLEKTKTKLDNYYSFRNKYPHLLKNRDPSSPEIKLAGIAYTMCFADKLTKIGERVLFIKPNPDASIFELDSHLKRFFMLIDQVYLEKDRHTYCTSIMDCQTLNFVHILKGLGGTSTGVEIFYNAYSERVKAMHVINAPAHLSKVVDTFKSFFPKKIAQRMFFHGSPEELCRAVDEDVVCKEFGGKGPSLAEYDGK